MEKKNVIRPLCYTWMVNEEDYESTLELYKSFAEKEDDHTIVSLEDAYIMEQFNSCMEGMEKGSFYDLPKEKQDEMMEIFYTDYIEGIDQTFCDCMLDIIYTELEENE